MFELVRKSQLRALLEGLGLRRPPQGRPADGFASAPTAERSTFPPRADCPECMSGDFEFREMQRTGHASTPTRRSPPRRPASTTWLPTPSAVVDLEEGGRLLAWIGDTIPTRSRSACRCRWCRGSSRRSRTSRSTTPSSSRARPGERRPEAVTPPAEDRRTGSRSSRPRPPGCACRGCPRRCRPTRCS